MAMEAIRLNSLPKSTFSAPASEFGGNQDRADVVNVGRLLMTERAGRSQNALRKCAGQTEDYQSIMASKDLDYSEVNGKFQRNMLLYCAKIASRTTGEDAPADWEAFKVNQRQYFSDPAFLRVLAGVVRDIVTPVLPATMSGAMDWLAQVVRTPIGKTYEVDVASNDIFLFEDDSWGASKSKPANTTYDKTFTLNPTLRTANGTWKWYQFTGNDADIGKLLNAPSAGMYSKIMALWRNALVAASTNTTFTPTNMQFTYSNANWITAAKRVAMLNNVGVRQVVAFGDLLALSHVLPASANGANTNLDAALADALGADWARYGYAGEFMGVRLFPIDNAIVPGTQNTTISEIMPSNAIWFAAAVGSASKPIYICFEEGTPITFEIAPSQSADMTLNVTSSISVDVQPIFASRIGYMTPV